MAKWNCAHGHLHSSEASKMVCESAHRHAARKRLSVDALREELGRVVDAAIARRVARGEREDPSPCTDDTSSPFTD